MTYDMWLNVDLMYEIIGERSKRAGQYQECTNSSWCGVCGYIYIYIYFTHTSPLLCRDEYIHRG